MSVSSLSSNDKYHLTWLTWLLYQLTQLQREANKLPGRPESDEKPESRREAVPVVLTQGLSGGSRMRKVGCKVFFWKSWTAC
ncbi:hypothetical protein DPEC_G00055450 [Dallia pectoralis]|uniref:Uncharacterized protein n=1 Tax=Dallia pectoralis TaxID=75939 RepID=A0ACC2H5I9_DALPE|nr:hypothetical protein DPEC_G00055450 [Dallia pectoralis]